MPSDSSFDIVSELNLQEMDNAVNQAMKEIGTRYDFKGSAASLEFDRKTKELTLTADQESQLEAVRKVIVEKMIKRGVDPKALDPQKLEQATHKTVRQTMAAAGPSSSSAMTVVSGPPPRSEPSGEHPPVTVILIRARAGLSPDSITSATPDAIASRPGSPSPSPSAERRSRSRCLLSANGIPAATLTASKTPSPVVRP